MNTPLVRSQVLCGFGGALLFVSGCSSPLASSPVPGGDVDTGRLLIEQYGCGTCHVVPGVRTAVGQLGPPLDAFARHVYIAGELPNDPEILVRWIQSPQSLVATTTMPDLNVNEPHARDIAAYLYTLR